LFFDKVLRMGVGLFIGVWIARYLGPEQYGLWNYAIAFTAIFGAIASLGLDSIVIRELIRTPENTNVLLGTTFYLKLSAGLLACAFPVIIIYVTNPHDSYLLWIVAVTSAQFIFLSIDTVDIFYQSKILSKYTVIAKNSSFIVFSVLKYLLIMYNAPLIFFIYFTTGEVILASVLLAISYYCTVETKINWKHNFVIAKELLNQSYPIIFSGIIIMVYMKIDQIMLGNILGNKAVGEYSAAIKISEIWYMVPTIAISSLAPFLTKIKMENQIVYYKNLQKLFTFMLWASLIVSVIFLFASDPLIKILFGAQYAHASMILKIHIWSSVPVFFGSAWSCWIIIENRQKITFITHTSASVLNIALNIYLIPLMGVTGAAVATIISYAVGLFTAMTLYKAKIAFNFLKNALILKF